MKDRVAKSMIEAAEAEGAIEDGQTILEPTSGNTGISLAMICRRKGYPLRVVMPDNVTEERSELLRMFGAEIVYSEGAKGSNGAVEMALELADGDSSVYMPYQYGNPANPAAHYHGTAVEILDELDEVSAFVAGLGTGGTLMGVGRRLKESDPETKIVAAEPMQGELVQGLRSLDDGFIPPIIDLSVLDRKIMVSNRDAIVWTQRLLREEGLFAGVSAGAVASVCVRIAGRAGGRQRRLPGSGRRLEVPLLGRLHEARRRAGRPGLNRLVVEAPGAALGRAAARVRELQATYEPPDFAHVPDPDAAIFLCAVDHKTGYERSHEVGGEGPFAGSELMWELGLRAAASTPDLLSARRLRYTSAGDVAEWFRAGDETVEDPERRAWLWRDLGAGLERDCGRLRSEAARRRGRVPRRQGRAGRAPPAVSGV